MDKEFKIGDYVILLDSSGIYTLEQNKSYKIIDIRYILFGHPKQQQLIALEGTETEDDYGGIVYPKYNSRRFTKDIKIVRKMKIQKIYASN